MGKKLQEALSKGWARHQAAVDQRGTIVCGPTGMILVPGRQLCKGRSPLGYDLQIDSSIILDQMGMILLGFS